MHTTAASDRPSSHETRPPAAAPTDAGGAALRLGVSGLDASERETLGSILRVLEARTARPWRLCTDPEADLHLHTRDGGLGPHRGEIVGLIVREGEAPAPHSTIALPAPFRVMSVLDVLNDAYDRLVQRRHPRSAMLAAGASPAQHGDGRSLAAALARIIERRLEQNLRIRILSYGTLCVFPAARAHGLDFEPARLGAALDEHRFVITALAQDAPDLPALFAGSRPIDEVLWQVGLATPWNRDGLDDLCFRLRRWPDLARLPHRAAHIALCAALAAGAATRAALADATGADEAEVTQFLHACELCGLTSSEPDVPEPSGAAAPPAANRFGGLFERLRRRLGL